MRSRHSLWTTLGLAALPLLLPFVDPGQARADVLVLTHEFTPQEASAAGGRLGQKDGVAWLALRGGRAEPRTLVTLEVPPMPHAVLELRGHVRGQDIAPAAELVMWLDYGEGHRYRVATDGLGPTSPLEGTFESRAFAIPYAGREGDTLQTVELQLLLPGHGVVALGPVRLVALDQVGLSARARPWFADEQVAPLFMPVGFGLLAIALAVGLCAILGLFRDLALLTLRIVAFAGLLVLGAGGFGMSQSQPPEVYLPLLGAGGITLVFALMLYGPTLRRFRTVELERLPRLPRAH